MKKILLASAVMALLGVTVTMNVLAQPPAGEGRPDGPPPRGEGGPDDRPRPPHPVMDALDKDHNGEISEEEINNATAATRQQRMRMRILQASMVWGYAGMAIGDVLR